MEKKTHNMHQQKHHHHTKNKSAVWDCGSSLYDSFELETFKRQLESAIAIGRTLSMPHTSVEPPTSNPAARKKTTPSSRVPKSISRLLRTVFRVKPARGEERSTTSAVENEYFVIADDEWMGRLETIPEETWEKSSGAELKYGSVRRTLSERWFARRTGLMCQ